MIENKIENWGRAIEFFNTHQRSTREQYLEFMGGIDRKYSFNTFDTYRNNLRSAGFLRTLERGFYSRVKRIPDMSIKDCLEIIKTNNMSKKEKAIRMREIIRREENIKLERESRERRRLEIEEEKKEEIRIEKEKLHNKYFNCEYSAKNRLELVE
jgi:hypothetical protein